MGSPVHFATLGGAQLISMMPQMINLMVNRPCSCGCDARDGVHGVGYLSGSDAAGNGFTLWIKDAATYRRLAQDANIRPLP